MNNALPYCPFSAKTRVMIVVIIALTGLVSPLSANMYYPSITRVRVDLHTTHSGITWTVTSYVIAMAVFPLLWSNLADYIGRKPVYAFSMLIFICGSIGCALSQNLPALVASRIVQSAGASAVQGAGAGTISDIYPREQRGTALGLYYLGPLLGPCLGPLIGGYIGEGAGWRWVFWVLTIWGGIMFLLAIFVLPETHRRIVAEKHAIQQVNIPPLLGLKDNNPLEDMTTIRYPVIALAMLHFAMLFGAYFTNATAQPVAYEGIYGLSQGMSGLCFLPSGVGCVVGSTIGGRVTDLLLQRHHSVGKLKTNDKERGSTIMVPAETRLGAMWAGSALFLCGVVICGWLLQYKLSLAGVLVSQFFIGSGMAFTFQSLGSYLIDVFPTKSARITGVQNFWRSAWAAVIVQLSPNMLENIGWGWTYTTMFFLTFTSLLLMQLVVYRGEAMRQRYGPSIDTR
ncbi:MFS general substrate transporter [Coemansia reversa NRRL 1564]|uniref:MFS general substrate transporter n=1 Tax=Coemansia reversa (strain ATCC 12441 / NRRL 1564) TaxID=763665 RepID=A0A2G5B0Y2_COERN|nr:MFS general substrate transporter [Coemansia reversa NRRL 1564]|eukprot:PIA12673.1 MFS general substrate transporter [Coemansia reversa NRRL 1564]